MEKLLELVKQLARETELASEEAKGKDKWRIDGQNSAYHHVIALIEELQGK